MPEYIISVIGALRAGCVISGVSPLLSTTQIQYQLNDLGENTQNLGLVTLDSLFASHIVRVAPDIPKLKLIITTSAAGFLPFVKRSLGRLLKKISSGNVTPIKGKDVIDFHKDVLKKSLSDPVNIKLSADDLGFIQYTGGTTGAPKGAMLTHRNSVANILCICKWIGWERESGVVLSAFPMFHTAGLTICEILIFLARTQILIPNPRDTDLICDVILKYRPYAFVNVPSLYQLLMLNPRFREIDHSTLQICMSGASPLPMESQMELEGIIGRNKVLEVYGMTEVTAVATMNPVRGEKRLGSVGMPYLNTYLKIVDPETGNEVPLGEAGEIYVKSKSVMKGYYNDPEETKIAIDSDGYMHTGDVGIMDEDGYIRIVDRTKDMLIVGGFNVFSSKVESIISKHPAIVMLAIIGVANPDRPGSEIVKAYIQLDPEYNYDGNEDELKEDITNFSRENCSPYEVPKIIEFVDNIPLAPVGKMDKKLLRV